MASEEQPVPPIEIPAGQLSDELLASVIEHFVLREGTDYGNVEASLETKIKQVQKQIDRGDVRIVFDANTDSVTLMTKNQFTKYY